MKQVVQEAGKVAVRRPPPPPPHHHHHHHPTKVVPKVTQTRLRKAVKLLHLILRPHQKLKEEAIVEVGQQLLVMKAVALDIIQRISILLRVPLKITIQSLMEAIPMGAR